jgi:hypothetical protein
MGFLVACGHVCGVSGVVLACGNAGVTRSDEWVATVKVKRTNAAPGVFAGRLRLMRTGHITVVESPYEPTGDVLDIASPKGCL